MLASDVSKFGPDRTWLERYSNNSARKYITFSYTDFVTSKLKECFLRWVKLLDHDLILSFSSVPFVNNFMYVFNLVLHS